MKGKIGNLLKMLIGIVFIIVNLVYKVEVIYFVGYAFFAFTGVILHPFFFVFHMSYLLIREP